MEDERPAISSGLIGVIPTELRDQRTAGLAMGGKHC